MHPKKKRIFTKNFYVKIFIYTTELPNQWTVAKPLKCSVSDIYQDYKF